MLGSMVSGIMMSKKVFSFLPTFGGMGFARTLHMLAAYWGFIFMSLHLGLHWGMVLGMVRKSAGIQKPSAVRTWCLRISAAAVCMFGLYAFVKNDLVSYLFLQNLFVFFDKERPLILFFAEYTGMMGLWACLAHYSSQLIQSRQKYKMKRKQTGGKAE